MSNYVGLKKKEKKSIVKALGGGMLTNINISLVFIHIFF